MFKELLNLMDLDCFLKIKLIVLPSIHLIWIVYEWIIINNRLQTVLGTLNKASLKRKPRDQTSLQLLKIQ